LLHLEVEFFPKFCCQIVPRNLIVQTAVPYEVILLFGILELIDVQFPGLYNYAPTCLNPPCRKNYVLHYAATKSKSWSSSLSNFQLRLLTYTFTVTPGLMLDRKISYLQCRASAYTTLDLLRDIVVAVVMRVGMRVGMRVEMRFWGRVGGSATVQYLMHQALCSTSFVTRVNL
jgi:hypothetical protein